MSDELVTFKVKPIADAAIMEVVKRYNVSPTEAILIMYKAWLADQPRGGDDGRE